MLTPSVARTVLSVLQASRSHPSANGGASESKHDEVTPRELEFLKSLALGKTYAEIGDELGIGINSVRSLVRSTYPKLQARTAAHAIAIAFRKGLI